MHFPRKSFVEREGEEHLLEILVISVKTFCFLDWEQGIICISRYPTLYFNNVTTLFH